VTMHGLRLFRGKLAIKIFPESIDDLWTIHSRPPMPGSGRGPAAGSPW
jgi:hypothetical protein